MSTLNKKYLSTVSLHPALVWSISTCSEAKGLQELWYRSRPELVAQLKESALIQSAESSNRLEGVEVEKKRLKPLLSGQSKPRDRSEEELYGYRRALDLIHTNKLEITPATIKKIHKIAQGGLVGDAGQWKTKDNEIIEFSTSGEKKIRFRCTSSKETPGAIENLCENYRLQLEQKQFPELLVVASFVFDFLCIHPFRDGNGRVSRLLTLVCLYQSNYQIGRFISLERIIESSKVDYYEALHKSSQGWHENKHDIFPWWSYFLSIVKSGYQELKDKVELTPRNIGTKTSLIQQIILDQTGEFKISELLALAPHLDREIIKKTLSQMKKDKRIYQIGAGRASRWKTNK